MQKEDGFITARFISEPGIANIPAMPPTQPSSLVRIKDNIWGWYSRFTLLQFTGIGLEEMKQMGFELLPDQSVHRMQCILMHHSQLRILATDLGDTDTLSTYFVRPSDIEALKNCPVILASTLVRPEDESSFTTGRIYPPAEHGTVGIVVTGERGHFYSISDLPIAAQERQKQIRQGLEELETQTPSFRAMHSQPEKILFNRDEVIQNTIQQLAQDYYQYHQIIQSSTTSKNKPIPSMANAFNNGMAEVFTAVPFQAYSIAAIARLDTWQQESTDKEHEVIISHAFKKPSGTVYVQVRGDTKGLSREMVIDELLGHIKKKSDLDSDIFLAMIAQMMKGEKDEEGNTWISAGQILKYRGIQPKMNKTEAGKKYAGGYRQEDIEEISQHVRCMENEWIKIHELEIIDETDAKGKRKKPRKTISRESRLFMFGDKITHTQKTLDGTASELLDVAWQYRESSWMIPFLTGPNRFTGYLFEKVLNYDPYHEKWEKRLGKHFLFWLRTNASYERKPGIYIGDLLRELNLEINERFPQRTQDRFEKAMNRLMEDRLLTWDYKEKIKLPERKWLTTWLQQQIIVDDSPEHKDQYLPIKTKAQIIRAEKRVIHQKRRKRGENANDKAEK